MKRTSIYQNNPQKFFQDFSSRNEQAVAYALETILPYIKNLAKSYPQLQNETGIIANDVIMKGFEQIAKEKFVYKQDYEPMAYLFKIAKFGVKNAAKRNANWVFCDIEATDYDTATFDYQPNWENRDIVANILRQLPKEHRKIFLLRLQGYEYEEMQETGWLHFSNAIVLRVVFNKDKKKLQGLGEFLA